MNERIEQLKEQASEVLYALPDTVSMEHGMDVYQDKLIELTVRECANFTDPVTRKLMMKHFGIEE